MTDEPHVLPDARPTYAAFSAAIVHAMIANLAVMGATESAKLGREAAEEKLQAAAQFEAPPGTPPTWEQIEAMVWAFDNQFDPPRPHRGVEMFVETLRSGAAALREARDA